MIKWKNFLYHYIKFKMFIVLISILVSVWLFGLYAVVHIEEHQKKLQIHEKLMESVQKMEEKMDLHNL